MNQRSRLIVLCLAATFLSWRCKTSQPGGNSQLADLGAANSVSDAMAKLKELVERYRVAVSDEVKIRTRGAALDLFASLQRVNLLDPMINALIRG